MITASKLIMKIEELQQELSEGAMTSPSADFAAYRHLTGRYKGLQEAINLIQEFKDEEE